MLALAAVPAIAEQIGTGSAGSGASGALEPWLRWTTSLALLGYATAALNDFSMIGRLQSTAAAYVAGDAATKAAIAVQPLFVLDAQGWLTCGAVGLWLCVVNLSALRARRLPAALAYTGVVGGLLYASLVAGFVLANDVLVSSAAMLGGVILVPLWFIWTGVRLTADAPAPAAWGSRVRQATGGTSA